MHVYINGFYWGMYNMVERPDQSFAAAYYETERYAWDGINSGSPINADGDRFRSSRTAAGMATCETWHATSIERTRRRRRRLPMMQLQGLNPDGTNNPDWEDCLDFENMVDYLIVNYYGDNATGRSRTSTSAEKTVRTARFSVFLWDAEWSLFLRSNVNGNNVSDSRGVAAPFQYLRTSEEFRTLFGDRVQKHFSPAGHFTWIRSTRIGIRNIQNAMFRQLDT